MYAGKTTVLLQDLRRASLCNKRVVLCKPEQDTRYSRTAVVTHDGTIENALVIQAPEDLLFLGADVVGIDEAQFFDESIVEVVEALTRKGVMVIAAGLNLDSFGKPFGPMADLIARADRIEHLTAVCSSCYADATRTLRTVDSKSQVLLGAHDAYRPMCYKCWCKHVYP
jgi:thymidine kinase